MEIKAMNDGQKNRMLVWMGMVDLKLAAAQMFKIDVNNVFPKLCVERAKYLRYCLQCDYFLEKQPSIVLFFVAYDNVRMYVHDELCGERKYGKRLIFDHSAMLRPGDVAEECLKAYRLNCEIIKFNEHETQSNQKKPELLLIRGGK